MDSDYLSSLEEKTISITTEDYDFTDVPALCGKHLGIHLTVDADTAPAEQKYSVTHLKTGCCISPRVIALPLECAVDVMQSLEKINCWNFSQIDGLIRMANKKSGEINLTITKTLRNHNIEQGEKKDKLI